MSYISCTKRRNWHCWFTWSKSSRITKCSQTRLYLCSLGHKWFHAEENSSEITANEAAFSLRISDDLSRSRVIFSLPTPTNRYNESQEIEVFHKSTTNWIRNTEGHKETEERSVHFNSNSNFRSDDWYQKKKNSLLETEST